jgi:glutamate 5-kinase
VAKLYVLKIGSRLAIKETGVVHVGLFRTLLSQLDELYEKGDRFIIVLSGAISLGWEMLGKGLFHPQEKGHTMIEMQIAWSIGQSELLFRIRPLFRKQRFHFSFIPYTHGNFSTAGGRQKVHDFLHHSLRKDRLIPIINEHDALDTTEIEQFEYQGDNDKLARAIATIVGADEVHFLSSVPGYMEFPAQKVGEGLDLRRGKVIHMLDKPFLLEEAKKRVRREVEPFLDPSQQSTGGMYSKLDNAQKLGDVGITSRIYDGSVEGALLKIAHEKTMGASKIGTCVPTWATKRTNIPQG